MTVSNSGVGLYQQTFSVLSPEVQQQLGKAVTELVGKSQKMQKEQQETGQISEKTLQDLAKGARPALPPPNVTLSRQELTALIQKMMISTLNQQAKSQTEATKMTNDQLQSLAKKNVGEIQKIANKLNDSGVGTKIAKALGWIAAIIAVVASVAFAVVSFGSGAPLIGAAMLGAAAITVAVTIMTETGGMQKMTEGMAKPLTSMFESFGMSKLDAKRAAEITAQVVVAVAILAVDISLAIMSGGAGAAKTVVTTMQRIAKAAMMISRIAQGAGAAVQVGGAAATTTSAVYQHEAAMSRAKITETKAYVSRLQALLEQEQETLREVLQSVTKDYTEMDSVIKAMHSTNTQMLSQWASA